MRSGSNLPRVGDFNRAIVLEAIRHSGGGLTRATLSRMTGLAPQTISNSIRDLLGRGLVVEAGQSPSEGRGRPGRVLQLDPSGRYAVGVHIDPASLGIVILNLAGALIAESYEPLPGADRPAALTSHLSAQIDALVTRASIPAEQLLGIGLAAPGPLEEGTGTVSPPLLPGWDRIPLRDALTASSHSVVLLDKDVTAAAKARVWQAGEGRTPDFLYLYVGAGVAMAAVIDGEVIRGRSGNAGEAGHLTGDPAGPECSCGKRGCLGASIGEFEMVRHARDAGIPLSGVPGSRDPREVDAAFFEFLRLADDGDPTAAGLFDEAGRSAAMAVTMVGELLETDTVIIGGPRWDPMRRLVEPSMRPVLDGHRVHGAARPITLDTDPLGWRAGAVGAACLILDEVFTPKSSTLLINP
ncbi:ROK family transcriptional regulator [Actinomyces gerencseriae]|uniref:ROK family transcriptional regulator n=1 Tax=Actinomyces gerencseriae TaxID=52769 RepID=UPI0028EA3375|nr:ROK family transcriptional regulator [Actinomyces gerencseriae]